jgi:hypothetical protein
MNQFEFFAHGPTFDVDAYLKDAPFPVTRVWRRGQGRYRTSGIAVTLGDGEMIPTFEQERLAIEFLSKHRDALLDLSERPGLDFLVLGLQVRVRFEEGLVGFSIGPSTLLMRCALDAGVEPWFFVALKNTTPPPSTDAEG